MLAPAMNPRLPPGNFYGEMLRQHQAGGFSLTETRYLSGTKLPRHSHESHYVGLVLSGAYNEHYGRSIRSCQPAMVVCHPAGELHAQDFNHHAVQLFRIEVNQTRLEGVSQKGFNLECRDFRGGLPVGLASKLYGEFREPDAVSHLAIEGLGLELIAARARDSQRP